MRTVQGFVVIPRENIIGVRRLKPAIRGLYCSLYAWANWEDAEHKIGKEIMKVPAGSCWTTYEEICGQTALGRSMLKSYLNKLIELELIEVVTTDYGSLITIRQYIDGSSSEKRYYNKKERIKGDLQKKERRNTPEIYSIWNEHGGGLPKASGLSPKRLAACNARWNENPDSKYWTDLVRKVAANEFLSGQNDRGWKATIDWFTRPDSHLKINEGTYDRKAAGCIETKRI